MNIKNNRGYKPVHLAKSASVALFLIEHNEETTTDERSKWWTEAAGEHNVNVIAKLLPTVDINYQDGYKRTALHWAVVGDDDETEAATVKTVELFLNKGASVDITDKNGRTALHAGEKKIIKKILNFFLMFMFVHGQH
jgi:ankyrin repeat protein